MRLPLFLGDGFQFDSVGVCIVLLVTLVPNCHGIRCYKCDSTVDVGCQEIFEEDSHRLNPVECSEDVYQGRFCIKTTGMYGGKPGTRRFCSSKNLGNMCNYIRRPNDPMEFRACIFTCTGELCNNSSRTAVYSNTAILPILITILMRFS